MIEIGENLAAVLIVVSFCIAYALVNWPRKRR